MVLGFNRTKQDILSTLGYYIKNKLKKSVYKLLKVLK